LNVELTVTEELVEAIAQRAAELVLAELADLRGPAAEEPPLLSVEEAADFLRADRQRVYDLCSSGRLERVKDGARTLIRRSDLEAHLNGGQRRRAK
jgi:excisionase family DNA binding protein